MCQALLRAQRVERGWSWCGVCQLELTEVQGQLSAGALGQLWGPSCLPGRPGRIDGKNKIEGGLSGTGKKTGDLAIGHHATGELWIFPKCLVCGLALS